eukprot:gene28399-37335_t
MDKLPRDMKKKRQRHFHETRTIISVALIITGICVLFCLLLMWPQVYMVNIFNSRLGFHLILDVNDYFTCNRDYQNFIIDEPEPTYGMYQIFVFNVTNAAEVIQSGYKPTLAETGPFGFVKYSYKYDVHFDDNKASKTVRFKEYSILREQKDTTTCQEMFFRMGRDYLVDNPCKNGVCDCKSLDSPIVTVNPLFEKTIWKESASTMLSYYAQEPFAEVQRQLYGPFVTAVKAHLVLRAYKDVYSFRTQMQVYYLLTTAFQTLRKTYSITKIATFSSSNVPSSCGLSKYGIKTCPFDIYSSVLGTKSQYRDINSSVDYPSVAPLLEHTYRNISFLDEAVGLPKWLSILWWLGRVEFNPPFGYVTVSKADVAKVYLELCIEFATLSFGHTYTANQLTGTKRVVDSVASFLAFNWIKPYSNSALFKLVKQEYLNVDSPVPCSPTGIQCVWQLAYMRSHFNFNVTVSDAMVDSFIDTQQERATNPNSLYKDLNGPPCIPLTMPFTLGLPAYPNLTASHDHFVVGFFNSYFSSTAGQLDNEPFNHKFVVGEWDDFGAAQWGGGFITYALEGVRSTNQIGFSQAFIYSIRFNFRRHIVEAGTTFVGDGTHYTNGIAFENCVTFETTLTSPSTGIQCDSTTVFGHPHPYLKQRGNIVFQMVFVYAVKLLLTNGLWCGSSSSCNYQLSGMFVTTTVRKLLFDGFTDPPYDECGRLRYSCNDDGVVMYLPQNRSKILKFGGIPNEEFFAPEFEVVPATGELLWPLSRNTTQSKRAKLVRSYAEKGVAEETEDGSNITYSILTIQNPYFAMYPAWNSLDLDFLKHYQCKFRMFGGKADLLHSCEDTLQTGLTSTEKALNIVEFHGNSSIVSLSSPIAVNGSSSNSQHPMYLWSGFQKYAYNYLGNASGPNYSAMSRPYRFIKQHAMNMLLSQESLLFDFQKEIPITLPLPSGSKSSTSSKLPYSMPTRRFVEEKESWNNLRVLGTPTDSFGMPYTIPIGMVDIRVEAGPLFPSAFQSQSRCIPPTRLFTEGGGYGCFTYIPLLWFEESKTVTYDNFQRLYKHYYNRPARGSLLITWGLTLGLFFLLTGIILLISEMYKRFKFQRRLPFKRFRELRILPEDYKPTNNDSVFFSVSFIYYSYSTSAVSSTTITTEISDSKGPIFADSLNVSSDTTESQQPDNLLEYKIWKYHEFMFIYPLPQSSGNISDNEDYVRVVWKLSSGPGDGHNTRLLISDFNFRFEKPPPKRVKYALLQCNEDEEKSGNITCSIHSGQSRPNPRIFCGIYSMASRHTNNIRAIADTWGKQCDGFLVFSTGVYLGRNYSCQLDADNRVLYNTGSAGYILDRVAVKKLAAEIPMVGIAFIVSLPIYLKNDPGMRVGFDFFSPESVSFHYITPELMIQMHDFLNECPREIIKAFYDSKGQVFFEVRSNFQLVEK